MSEGRKTRRGGPKDEKAKLDRDWQKISQVGILRTCLHKYFEILCIYLLINPRLQRYVAKTKQETLKAILF